MANKKSKNLKRQVTFSVTQVMLFVLVFAAVGGYAIWKSLAAPQLSATLVASPNPVSPNGIFKVSGCGFTPNVGILVSVVSPTATSSFGGPADANGCYDSTKYGTEYASNLTGQEYIKAYQSSSAAHGKIKNVLMASTVLQVQ